MFLNAAAQAMTRSGFGYLHGKLRATRDVRKVSLRLGHASLQSTEIYLRADLTEKLEALASMAPPTLKPGRLQAPDRLLAMLRTVGRPSNYAE